MKPKLLGLTVAACVILIAAKLYALGYAKGLHDGSMTTEKRYMEQVLSLHLGYLVKQEGRESFIEYRYVPKVRRCPVIHRDAEGNEIDKGGGIFPKALDSGGG